MGPLTGVRVLDFTQLLPGPWCTMTLGDLGAEVIKVERPEGDSSRAAEPRYQAPGGPGESVYFCNVNRNKRSVVADLKNKGDLQRILVLVAQCDVVIEGFRPGVADKLGIGREALTAINPSLIYCSLSGYGQTGALRHLAGHDLNIAGMSGLLQPRPDVTPAMPTFLMGDYAGAVMALVGILAALAGRARDGRGAALDVSMLDALISWTNVQMTGAFARADGAGSGRAVEGWGGNPRYNIYRTRDGLYLTVSLLEKRYWDAFCRMFGRDDLINPHETEADRLTTHGERGELYRSFIHETLLSDDRDVLAARFRDAGIPICPVLTPDEVFQVSYGQQQRHFQKIAMTSLGRQIPQMGFPLRMAMTDGSSGFALHHSPPALGEANSQFLKSEPVDA
jgi:crotonobetainyl-CoA:carnitine CoA-transferase CaiB-like acyl-CoA transferase